MLGALKRLFGPRDSENASKSLAKSRLHFVLVQDRTGLTSEEMALFKEEMVKVIERYFVIDKDGFDIKYQREMDTTTLLINSPVIVRRVGAPTPPTAVKAVEPEEEEKEASPATTSAPNPA